MAKQYDQASSQFELQKRLAGLAMDIIPYRTSLDQNTSSSLSVRQAIRDLCKKGSRMLQLHQQTY